MWKLRTAVVLILLCGLPVAANAFPADKGGNCLDCHKLEKKEAEAIVKKIAPDAKVLDIKAAPVKSFWLIEVEAGARRGGILLDFSKKYLAQLTPVEALTPKKVDYHKISLKDAILLGAKNAKKKVVVFTDPDCPYCRKLHEEMKQVIVKRKDIAFELILFPLPMHKDAYPKAQAILCEKSLTLLDDAFAGKPVPEPKCSNEALERNLAHGKELGISGTPALIREDGTMLSGTRPVDQLIDWIDGK